MSCPWVGRGAVGGGLGEAQRVCLLPNGGEMCRTIYVGIGLYAQLSLRLLWVLVVAVIILIHVLVVIFSEC